MGDVYWGWGLFEGAEGVVGDLDGGVVAELLEELEEAVGVVVGQFAGPVEDHAVCFVAVVVVLAAEQGGVLVGGSELQVGGAGLEAGVPDVLECSSMTGASGPGSVVAMARSHAPARVKVVWQTAGCSSSVTSRSMRPKAQGSEATRRPGRERVS